MWKILGLFLILNLAGVFAAAIAPSNGTESQWSSESAFNMDCPNDTEVISANGRSLCCDKCDTGFGMVRMCTPSNATVCEQCTEGVTFNNEKGLQKCKPCTLCNTDANMVKEKKCSVTGDAQCRCIRGYFLINDGQNCQACKKCTLGTGRVTNCSRKRDAQCSECNFGMFSQYVPAENNYLCQPCHKCIAGDQTVRSCSSKSDTYCKSRHTGQMYYASRPAGNSWRSVIYNGDKNGQDSLQNGTRNNFQQDNPSRVDSGNNLIPLYCALMGLLILGLVIYVVVKHWQRRHHSRMSAKNGLLPPSPRPVTLTVSGTNAPLLPADGLIQHKIAPPPHLQGLQGKRKSIDSGLGGVNCDDLTSATNSTRKFRDVSQEIKKRIEVGFYCPQQGQDWLALGRELGYSDAELAVFSTQATEEHVPACRCLLERWSTSPQSTVGALSRALQKLGRLDLILLLREKRILNKHPLETHRDSSQSPPPICQV